VFHLTRLLFRRWTQLLAAAALVLHPLLLDLMVAARGYGLALGFFTWALYFAIGYLTKGYDTRLLWRSGMFAGLAIASNLTLAFPAGALGVVLLALAGHDGSRSAWTVADNYGGPGIAIAFLVVVLPLLPATSGDFYFGSDNLFDTARSMVDGIAKTTGTPIWWSIALAAPVFGYFVLPALTMILGAAAVRTIHKLMRAPRPDFRLAPFAIFGGTLVITICLLFAAHHLIGLQYPYFRSGVYLIPLFTLALLTGVRLWGARAERAAIASVALLIAVYLNQTDNRLFGAWRFDASTGAMLRRMQDDLSRQTPQRPASLAISPVLSNTVRYYQIRRRIDWLAEPVNDQPEHAAADYFLLTSQDSGLIKRRGLRVIHEDNLSGAVLARRAY
jgi:hypothetical protein